MKNLLKCLLISYLLFQSLFASAQTYHIKGKIVDSSTKSELPSASIVLFKKSNKKIINTTITDDKGNFLFEKIIADTYIFKIQYLGYENYTIDSLVIKENYNFGTISISQIGNDLQTVNITSTKPVFEQKAGKLIVNVSESPLAAGSTVYEVLQKTPGVIVGDNNLSIKGKTMTLVIDDKLINIPEDQVASILKSMPSSSIEKIELISNPSAKYDGVAKAILHIKTKKAKKDFFAGTFTAGIGTGRLIRENTGVSLFYQKNKLSISTGIDYIANPQMDLLNRRNFIELPTSETLFYNENARLQYNKYNSVLKADIDYNLNHIHSIGFSVRPTLNYREDNTSNTNTITKNIIDSIYKIKTILNGKEWIPSLNFHYTTSFDTLKNKNLIININEYTYNVNWISKFTSDFFTNDYTTLRPSSLAINESPLTIKIHSASADYSYTNSWGKWEAGLKTSFTKNDSGFKWENLQEDTWEIDTTRTNQFIYNEQIHAAYIGISKEYKKINLELMLRSEYTYSKGISPTLGISFPRHYIQLFPSFNFEYTPSENNEWSISYRKSVNRSRYNYLNPFVFFISQNFYFQGNPYMIPQTDHSVEVVHSYKKHFFTSFSYLRMNNFLGSITRQDPITKVNIRRTENYSYANYYMLGFSFDQSITNWWTINASLQFAYFNAVHPEVASSPPSYNISPMINMFFSLPHEWKIEVSGSFSNPYSDGFYGHGIWYELNAGVKKSFWDKKFTMNLAINKILMPYWYETSVYYNRNFFRASYDQRFAMLSLTYNFGNKKLINKRQTKTGIENEKQRTGSSIN